MNREKDSTKKQERESQTVAQLLEEDRVPVGIRHWLEQYRERGDAALFHFDLNRASATMEQARLIHDVLDAQYQAIESSEFSEAARDYIEEYLYQLAEASRIHVWNQPDLAVTALPYLLDCAPGSIIDDATTAALKIAVRALTTSRERRSFIRDLQEERDETKEDRDYKAAMKLSRYLADPRTEAKVRSDLGAAIFELSGELEIHVDHPALVERAAAVMFESIDQAQYPAARRIYDHIHALLNELPEMPESKE